MTSSNCGLPDGYVHAHTDHCYRAGAVDALREAADELELVDSVEWALVGQDAGIAASTILRARADLIARGMAVSL